MNAVSTKPIETLPELVLKPNKDKAIRNLHHWVFSGAVASLSPKTPDGGFVSVWSHGKEFLGIAYVNRRASILARMIAFEPVVPLEAISRSMDEAIALRKRLIDDEEISAYRLINAEGDRLPGLTVDRYNDTLVVQLGTLGMDIVRDEIAGLLSTKLHPLTILERSDSASRREEGRSNKEGLLQGEPVQQMTIRENGMLFHVDPLKGQKTGFYLDQREMRKLVRRWASGRKVLNCFAYTGGFSVAAVMGGALRVDSVDSSTSALELARENLALNGVNPGDHGFVVDDVFRFLRESKETYGMVILDPPAFAKRKTDIISACRGYKDINRLALEKMESGGLLLTCSCSYHVDEKLFQQVVFEASVEAGRKARIIQHHHHAVDHPVNIHHPESHYLKSLLLYVE
ncbi:MAG TPA: class I SAM-dependent rRNA methyltransferase [bacterium]|nr:class I SAM-dependent rRNA methyltransferase [bacterium]